MLAAIERGKDTGVDYINGEVVWRAAEFGIPVPVNERIIEMINAISLGLLTPGLSSLAQLYAETRVADSPLFPPGRFDRGTEWMASTLHH